MEMDKRYEGFVSSLERLKRTAQNGSQYWMARDIQSALGYTRWESFKDVILKGQLACESAGISAENQFRQTTKLIVAGKGAERQLEDWFLSRYACYLIAMNSDSSKQEVGYAMTYFAVQTRRQERQNQLTGELKRAALRNRVRNANKSLNEAAKISGVQRYALFHDAGYKGLYNGLGKEEIQAKKGIPLNEDLLDCAGRAELAANEFRITQTESKLMRENIRGEENAISTHREVGTAVRATIKKLGGTMPEELPAEPSIKKLAAKVKAQSLAGSEQLLLSEQTRDKETENGNLP
jgi:DNA-damage-inducible protein D